MSTEVLGIGTRQTPCGPPVGKPSYKLHDESEVLPGKPSE